MLSTHSEKFLSPTSSAKKTPMLTPSPMPRWTAVHEYPPCGCEIECGCMKKEKESPFPKLAWIWLLVSFIFTYIILVSISLQAIPLSDTSCSLPTISECNARRNEQSKDEVRKILPSALENLARVREAIPLLKLLPASYSLQIVDKGSESQVRISYPSQTFSSGKIDLLCSVSLKQIYLKNGGQIELADILYTNNIQKDVENTIQHLNEFQGCTFVLQDQEFHPPPNTLVGPNAIVSWEMLMEPYLEFKIGVGVIIFLFIGIFALVGAALALVKQLITIARKGDRYFYIN